MRSEVMPEETRRSRITSDHMRRLSPAPDDNTRTESNAPRETVSEFLARGGKIKKIDFGQSILDSTMCVPKSMLLSRLRIDQRCKKKAKK